MEQRVHADDPGAMVVDQSSYIKFGTICIGITISLLCLLNSCFRKIGAPSSVPTSQAWMWKNNILSWFHAIVVGVWTLYCIGAYADLRKDPISFINPCTYAMLSFSTGYFLYDLSDHILNGQALKCWEVCLHHVGVILIFSYNLGSCLCVGYSAYALLTEVNSIFLHFRRALKMAGVDRTSRIYALNAWLNVVTCAIFRSLALGTIFYGMYYQPVRDRCGDAYFVVLSLVMIIMSFINPVLLYRLIKTDFLTTTGTRKHHDLNSNFKRE